MEIAELDNHPNLSENGDTQIRLEETKKEHEFLRRVKLEGSPIRSKARRYYTVRGFLQTFPTPKNDKLSKKCSLDVEGKIQLARLKSSMLSLVISKQYLAKVNV